MSQIFDDKRQQEIEAYLQKKMSQEEVVNFEEKLTNDQLLQEDVLLQESLQDSFKEDNWATLTNDSDNQELQELKKTLRSDPFTEISETIREVGADYEKKKDTKDRRIYYRMAIAAAVLLLCALPFFINSQSSSVYDQYANWETLPSLREKGDTQAAIIEGESLYISQKYKEAIRYFKDTIDASDPYYSYALMYLGASYFQTENLEKAHQTYNTLIATNSLQSSYGYWYKLLMYLKVENTEKANEMLTLILSNPDNYNYTEAQKIQAALQSK
ncbi:hypothetical protein [uncultured Dokdonia sp.]|uniref:tetratricopeptide repeat protein n=1 Tax=uncultured Dokdonia sp. TaxID=575653 RepID=UPI0026351C38|nr:hypothetical protein [uncultured Dokdonia sp.]